MHGIDVDTSQKHKGLCLDWQTEDARKECRQLCR
jgi:hypothetical protein